MDSLIFDEKKKEFTVLDGSLGKYSCELSNRIEKINSEKLS